MNIQFRSSLSNHRALWQLLGQQRHNYPRVHQQGHQEDHQQPNSRRWYCQNCLNLFLHSSCRSSLPSLLWTFQSNQWSWNLRTQSNWALRILKSPFYSRTSQITSDIIWQELEALNVWKPPPGGDHISVAFSGEGRGHHGRRVEGCVRGKQAEFEENGPGRENILCVVYVHFCNFLFLMFLRSMLALNSMLSKSNSI